MLWWKRKKIRASSGPSAPQARKPDGQNQVLTRLQKIRNSFVFWRKSNSQSSVSVSANSLVQGDVPDVLLMCDDSAVAFAINWVLAGEGQRQKLQAQAISQGRTHYVQSVDEVQIGFVTLSDNKQHKSVPIYSAALLLSECVSLGGDEVFAFRVDDSRYALVALKDSMPVPGFDLIGDEMTIANAVNDYLSLPRKTEVRCCGDSEVISGAEVFSFAEKLNMLTASHPQLKPIPNVRNLIFTGSILTGIALTGVLAWMGWLYFDALFESDRLKTENDPNVLYEQNFSNSIVSIKNLGTSSLKTMLSTLMSIPLDVAGWKLTSINCTSTECVATWERMYGNFAEFDKNLPTDVKQKPEYGFIGNNGDSTKIKTVHPVVLQMQGKKGESGVLKREVLPVVAIVQSDFVSRLQDYTLIQARVQVSPPSPFPSGVADIGPIFKPVVSGVWSMELPLWTMDSLTLPDYVQVESIAFDLNNQVGDPSDRTKSGGSTKYYKLTGKYYAKGKDY